MNNLETRRSDKLLFHVDHADAIGIERIRKVHTVYLPVPRIFELEHPNRTNLPQNWDAYITWRLVR